MSPVEAVRGSTAVGVDDRRLQLAWLLAVLATSADLATTAIGRSAGFPEGNPIVASVLANAGFEGFLALKVLAIIAAATVGVRFFERRDVAPVVLAAIWGGVAVVNAVVLFAA
jgi:hypothetical protein